jgi:hypothetical protein
MAHDTADTAGKIPHHLGDLFDVDDAALTVDKTTLVYSLADTEFKKVAPSATIADVAALTGGEAPTEAEFNALATKFNALLAACVAKGIIASA